MPGSLRARACPSRPFVEPNGSRVFGPRWPWLVAAGVYVLLIAVAPQLLGDPDTYSHLALGRWIFNHGAVPTVDPFSANFRRTHWLAFEWLSEVVFALAYAAGGWMGMVAIASAAAASAKPEKIYIAMQQKRRHFAA